MRPKLLSLLAVPALALVGCTSAEPSSEPTATVTVTATPSPTKAESKTHKPAPSSSESYDPGNLQDVAELSFYREARVRAPIAGDHTEIDQEEYAEALENYCLNGKELSVSEVDEFNAQLADNADLKYCPMIEQELNGR